MLVAALDTATFTLSCALVDVVAGKPPVLRCQRNVVTGSRLPPRGNAPPTPPPASRSHSAELPQALVDLLDAEGLAIPDIEGYAVGLGPGSFTGLRIGLATWKGLAYANRRPIAGASSLAAMAHAAAEDAGPGALLIPLLDARKGEVYAGFYRAGEGGILEVADDAALSPAALVARVAALTDAGARPVAFGEGLHAYEDALGLVPRLRTEVRSPPGFAVAALVAETVASAAFDAQALFALEPHYVRASEAEVKFPRGLGPGADRG